ncbi:MAG: SoxR reducing system RseC family protein [Bacteroidales bacterium]|nr:SoxR reducing system RseC family protein [Bacteroidales bacterium]
MEKEVCKEGIVRKLEGSKVWVEIVVSSACGGCAAKSLCNISEQKNELVEAVNMTGEEFSIGETVQIQMMQKLANKAVVLGYLLPFVILVAGLFVCYALTHIEWLSVLVGIGLTALYYMILKLMDKRLAKEFVLYASKKNE